jgi:hypothetical protein
MPIYQPEGVESGRTKYTNKNVTHPPWEVSGYLRQILSTLKPLPVRPELQYIFGTCQCGRAACNCTSCLKMKGGLRSTCMACAEAALRARK